MGNLDRVLIVGIAREKKDLRSLLEVENTSVMMIDWKCQVWLDVTMRNE